MSDSLHTSLTLIGRLAQRGTDQGAWDEFVRRYGATLRGWCRKHGLQDADIEDVVQNVLIELTRHIGEYEHRPPSRFRSWLRTVAERAWYDFAVRRRQLDPSSGGSAVLLLLNSVEAKASFAEELDAEWTRELLGEAMRRAKARVEPATWQAFVLMTFENLSGEQIGERLDMKAGAVFVARSRVRRLIEETYRQLESPDGEEG